MKVTKWVELFVKSRRNKSLFVGKKVKTLRSSNRKINLVKNRFWKSFCKGSITFLITLSCYALFLNCHAFFLPTRAASTPPNLEIYNDSLVNGWVDYGWANRDYSDTSIVRNGNNSISITAAPYEGIHLHHAAFDTSGYTALTFWIHGGSVGGQRLLVGGILSGKGQASYELSPLLPGVWQEVTISLSKLGVADKPDLDGFYIKDVSGTSSSTYYLDNISLTAVEAPSVVDINVDGSQILQKVDNRLFGLNSGAWESSFTSSDNTSLLKEIDNKVLRFPGGSLSDIYHWSNSTTLEKDETTTQPLPFDKFAKGAIEAGNQAFITVNYGSGTSAEATKWVRYSNKTKGYGFKYWEIGNESYGSWEYDTNERSHDPYTYAVKAKNYISKMKAQDPTIKVGVVVTTGEDSYANYTDHPATNSRTGQIHNGWTPVMLSTLKSLDIIPDFVIYHKYINGPGQENDATLLQSAQSWTVDIANLRAMLSDYLGTAGDGVEIVATEHNSVWSPPTGKQATNLVNGLFLADSIGQALQTELKGLLWWLMRATPETDGNNSASLYGWRQHGGYGILSQQNTGYERYPTFYIYKLLSKFARQGDGVLKVKSNYALVSAYAVKRTNGALSLLIINKSPTEAFNTNISISEYSPSKTATVYSYGIPQDEAARTGIGSPDIAQTTISNAGSSFSFQIAPYSASLISLRTTTQ
jgi:alpha-L-arabinofuranosidase